MTTNASPFSDRGRALIRTFQAAFHALIDHKSEAERMAIYDVIASHVRSSAPMALLGHADTLEPLTESMIVLADGAFVELRAVDGKVSLYVMDTTSGDACVSLTAAHVEQLRRDLPRVLLGVGHG